MQQVLVIGTPNSGKSLLFNRLTGLHHKVANFPGATVGVSSGVALANPALQLADFPGVYSLQSISEEERVAVRAFRQALNNEAVQFIICIVDVTRLEKGLYFALQVLRECRRHGKPVVIAANMIDVLHKHNLRFNAEALGGELGVPVLPLSAKTGEGFAALNRLLQQSVAMQDGDNRSLPELAALNDMDMRRLAQRIAADCGPQGDLLIASQARMDAFFLHSWLGGITFFAVMYLLFQSIFTWAAPVMDAVESSLDWLSSLILPLITQQTLRDFTADALFGGIGAFLVFMPQIFVLTLVIGILEDSGYLSRAAVICHKPLRLFGLTGKSFIPMLSGVACAIPGIYAARTIDSPRKRWLTYCAIPLMPCSARLPVYSVLIAAFVPAQRALGGIVGLQGAAMFGIYLFGMVAGLLVTATLSRRGPDRHGDLPFVLEMPPYRLPSWRPLLRNAWNRSQRFVTDAGPIIFSVTLVIWVLGYFPNHGAGLAGSWLGQLGKLIEPLFAPLGLDWKYGLAILTSFLAREVFVGTLGTLFGIENVDDNLASVADQIQASGLTLASGLSLLVFFALAMQCVSTLAVLARESGSTRLPVRLFAGYSLLAYTCAWLIYHLTLLVTG